MSQVKRFKLGPGLYALDSSGTAPAGSAMKARADRVHQEIKDSFDPSAVRVLSRGSREGCSESSEDRLDWVTNKTLKEMKDE